MTRLIFILLFLVSTAQAQQLAFGGKCTISNPNGNPVTYVPTATKFAGGDYLVHTGDLTGISDGGIFIVSFWFKLSDAAQDATFRRVLEFSGIGAGAAGVCRVVVDTANKVNVVGQNSVGTTVLQLKSSSSYTASATWHHVICSVDLSDSAKQFLYIDGANELNTSAFVVAGVIDFANGGNFGVMARGTDGNGVVTGSLSEVFFHTTFLDVSVAANRQLFRTVSGHPVNLASDGSTPLGVQPRVYLKNGFATFQTNLGTGGNFSVTGSLEDDTSTP